MSIFKNTSVVLFLKGGLIPYLKSSIFLSNPGFKYRFPYLKTFRVGELVEMTSSHTESTLKMCFLISPQFSLLSQWIGYEAGLNSRLLEDYPT